jgi:hypothetical protein
MWLFFVVVFDISGIDDHHRLNFFHKMQIQLQQSTLNTLLVSTTLLKTVEESNAT